MAFVIHITGEAGAGKTMLARYIERAYAPQLVAVLEWNGFFTSESMRKFNDACEQFALVVCVGDWPERMIVPQSIINVRRGISPEGRRYNSRPPGMASLKDNALPGGKSPSPETPDPTHECGRRCSRGTTPSNFSGLKKQFRAARELLSRASVDISVLPSLRLLTKSDPTTQP